MAAIQLCPRGINNIGNTCYLNTALQCLYGEMIVEALRLADESQAGKPLVDTVYTQWFRKFEFSEQQIHDLFTNPIYNKFNHLYKIGVTADAFDCTHKLLELLTEESPEIQKVTRFTYYPEYACAYGHEKVINENKPDISTSVLTNRAIFIKCLDIDKDSPNPMRDVGKNIIKYILNSRDETEIVCEECRKRGVSNSTLFEIHNVTSIPRILIIRFLDTRDACPTITLPKFSIGEFEFVPISTAYHNSGKPPGGHYHAVVLRRETLQSTNMYFYNINDRQVTKVRWPTIESGTNYVIYQANPI